MGSLNPVIFKLELFLLLLVQTCNKCLNFLKLIDRMAMAVNERARLTKLNCIILIGRSC